jgi:hypothetical protein
MVAVRYDISADTMYDIARELNRKTPWTVLSRQYGIPPRSLKRAYLRRSAAVYPRAGQAPREGR